MQLRVSQGDSEDLQRQLKAAEAAINDQQFKTAVLLAETERLKGNSQMQVPVHPEAGQAPGTGNSVITENLTAFTSLQVGTGCWSLCVVRCRQVVYRGTT